MKIKFTKMKKGKFNSQIILRTINHKQTNVTNRSTDSM